MKMMLLPKWIAKLSALLALALALCLFTGSLYGMGLKFYLLDCHVTLGTWFALVWVSMAAGTSLIFATIFISIDLFGQRGSTWSKTTRQ